jgi:UDP-N-acetyl-D-glucosamine dehydrogenase
VGRAVKGSRILVLGVAYKRDIDDVRESPALDIIRLLEEKGATVVYHDPYVPELREESVIRRSVDYSVDAMSMADCVLIATDHSTVDYRVLLTLDVPIVDTRNAMRGLESEHVIGLSGQPRGGPLEVTLMQAAPAD